MLFHLQQIHILILFGTQKAREIRNRNQLRNDSVRVQRERDFLLIFTGFKRPICYNAFN